MSPHAVSALLASGAASLVECIEALTVILAVAAARGWRPALTGSLAALAVLLVLVAALGPALRHLPLAPLRLGLGVLLLLFGARWLRKATRRAAGIIPLRDEAAAFERVRRRAGSDPAAGGWHGGAIATTFQATAVEGLEVVFIVLAVGSGGTGLWYPAVAGAGLALVMVALIGAALHRPITRVPENTLKQLAGALLCGFGAFWTGEGAGLAWPGGEFAMPVMAAACLLASMAAARIMRRRLAHGYR